MSKKPKKFNPCCAVVSAYNKGCDLSPNSQRNETLREMIEKVKNNPHMSLSEVKVVLVDTGEEYTLEEIDRLLNN